jgi:predicted nucleotidyltransferase
MDRRLLLAHLQRTRFAPGDRARAQADARAIALYLKREFGARVIGIGSAFSPGRAFRQTSDIDLVVEGLPAKDFYRASAHAAGLTGFALDLTPLESATPLLRERVAQQGVDL